MLRLRKIATLALLGTVLAVVLAACGGDDPTATPVATNTPVPTPTATLLPGVPTPTPAPPTPTPAATPTPSFDAAAHFKGKTISLMVGYGQGGGTDAQARYMASQWGKFIPGNPRIIVRNITPNITQRNFVWAAEPNGLTFSVEANPGISDQLEASAKFDMREVTKLGSTSGGDGVWMIWGEGPYDCGPSAVGGSTTLTYADTLGSWEDMGQQSVAAGITAELMGLPLELVHIAGDTGTNTQMLLLERGDTNSWITATIWTQLPVRRPGWQADGTIRAFVDLSRRGLRVPDSSEAAYGCGTVDDYVDKPASDLFYRYNDVGRAFAKNLIGPPGMAPGVTNALRAALDDAMGDAEFAAGLAKFAAIPVNYTPGAEHEEIMNRLTEGFMENQAEYDSLRQRLFEKYAR